MRSRHWPPYKKSVAAAEIIGALEGGAMQVVAYEWLGTEADRRRLARQMLERTLGEVEFDAAWTAVRP